MTRILTDLSEEALVRAVDANSVAYFSLLRLVPLLDSYHGPDMVWIMTGAPHPWFNGVAGTHLEPANVDARIEEVVGRFRARGVAMLWRLGPNTRPADVGTHLQAHGLTHMGDVPGMAADLSALNEEAPIPGGVSIERVLNNDVLRESIQCAAVVFGLPPQAGDTLFTAFSTIGFGEDVALRHYVAKVDGKVVATSTLFLAEGVAGIYNVATLPEARGKGIGAALTLTPLQEARDRGYRVGILQSSEIGYSVYEKLGFRECCKLTRYLWKPETSAQP